MDSETSCISSNDGYAVIILKALSLVPISHYIIAILVTIFTLLYNLLEFHFIHDLLFTAFRGDPVSLTCNSSSRLYHSVASKCHLLHTRYLPTPWLSGPHIQTAFLSLFGRAPVVNYRRQLFHTPDGGTLALDWAMHSYGEAYAENQISHDGKTPIAVIVPGLTSDSSAAYVKHMVSAVAKRGWTVVVSNHRGLGGIAITSECFYNAGWTDDVRRVIGYIHGQFPEAPLFAIGTSIGANILVKYLAEEGTNIPVAGAAAVCSPWDLLICDRFINRRLVQRLYNRVLTFGLQGYARLHQVVISRLTDWDSITKSRSVRDFDNYATRVLGRYETVDTYYRRCSSVNFVGNVAVPLLCISALDDPVCTREAIPWDECRANENIILAVTQHGGHLAYYEGISAARMWWVRAVDEFLSVLYSSPYMHKMEKVSASPVPAILDSSIDQGPYVNVTEDGMVAAVDEDMKDVVEHDQAAAQVGKENKSSSVERDCMGEETTKENSTELPKEYVTSILDSVRKRLDQVSQRNRKSIWLLVYIAVVTTWPLVGSAVAYAFKKWWKKMSPAKMLKR